MSIDLLSNCSDSFDSINIYVLKQLIHSGWSVLDFWDQGSQELYLFWVVVVNAEVKAIEQSERVLFYVIGVLGYDLNDLGIKGFSLLWVFLA